MYSVIVSFGVFVSLSFPISIDKGILGAYATLRHKIISDMCIPMLNAISG